VNEILFDLESLPDLSILLHSTSSVRTSRSIQEAIIMLQESDNAVVSMNLVDQYPNLMFENINGLAKSMMKDVKFTRREDINVYYYPTGSIYLLLTSAFPKEQTFYPCKTRILVTDSINSIDINNHEDWGIARLVLENKFTEL
jgi:CMP-N-acetylneuraminic acid synthetase